MPLPLRAPSLLALLVLAGCGLRSLDLPGEDTGCDAATPWFVDADGDGYGAGAPVEACEAPEASVGVDGDCDDADAAIHPGADEVCDAVDTDEDCDGLVDDDDPSATGQATLNVDADGDGFGGAATASACDFAGGHVEDATDCDDTSSAVAPGLLEVCGDGLDNDCVGGADACTFQGTYEASSHDLLLTGTATQERFGTDFAIGDFDGDGNDDLVAGAPGYRDYEGAATAWYGPLTSSGTHTNPAVK